MSEVVRKVFLGVIGSVAAVGIFLNWQIASQGREIILLKANQEFMSKRLDTLEVGMAEFRSIMRGMETSNRGEHEILRAGQSDMSTELKAHMQASTQILTYLKELMVWKDQSIEKGNKP